MRKYNVTLNFVTPCLLAGANQAQAEMRAASVRGALRFWFRVLGGTLAEEQELFGGCTSENANGNNSIASKIIVRIVTHPTFFEDVHPENGDYLLWPFAKVQRKCIKAGDTTTAELLIIDKSDSEKFERCLKVFCLLGSLGARSRRAYGSIYPVKLSIDETPTWKIPQKLDDFRTEINNLVKGVNISMIALNAGSLKADSAIRTCSSYLKSFRCGKTSPYGQASKWGESDHDVFFPNSASTTVYRAAIALPYKTKYYESCLIDNNGKTGTSNDRWASPICLKVLKFGKEFVPVMIFLQDYCLPADSCLLLSLPKKERPRNNDGSSKIVTVSHDLLHNMTDIESLKKNGWPNVQSIIP